MGAVTETKQGYKKTKLGWIPDQWGIKKINDFALKIGSGSTPRGGEKVYQKEGIPFIRSQNVNNEKLILKNISFIPMEIHKSMKGTTVLPNDILLNITGASIGRSCVVPNSIEEANVNQHVCIIRLKDSINIEFVQNFLSSFIGQKNILMSQVGGNREGLNHSNVRSLFIPLPPLPEQQKIAQILSTWDKAIEQSQNLIEQLKSRKKGLMQQLLTGKTRLKGFSGEWKEVKGGELFSNHSNKNHDGTSEVLSATQDKGVIPRSETGIDIKYDKASLTSYKKVEVGDYVISLRSFQGGIEYSNYEGLVSPAYTVLKEKMPISKPFYKEYMKTSNFINILNSIIYGIRDGKQISYKEFATLKLLYPPVEEQQAIAKVLITADTEIKAQETYLSQLQEQKKGLMQQLLTGQKRVKVV
jgi:type I restriction enzyme S subunit